MVIIFTKSFLLLLICIHIFDIKKQLFNKFPSHLFEKKKHPIKKR
jgi:hypothetical protein